MPNYLSGLRVDWAYEFLTPQQQQMVRKHAARLDLGPPLTADAVLKWLQGISREIGLFIVAVAQDSYDQQIGFRVDGDMADTDLLANMPDEEFKLLLGDDPMDPRDLTLEDYEAGAEGLSKVTQYLIFGDTTWNDIGGAAAVLDRSLSWMMQITWKLSRSRLDKLDPMATRLYLHEIGPTKEHRGRHLYFPFEMWREMYLAQKERDCSMTRLMEQAWVLVQPEIQQMVAQADSPPP